MPLSYATSRLLSKSLMAAGLIGITLFILSIRLTLGVLIGSHHTVQVGAGLIGWQWSISDFASDLAGLSHIGPLYIDRTDATLEWAPIHRDTPVRGDISVPIIFPSLALLIPGIVLARKHRFRPGCCKRCGYDLQGLDPGAPCPECGKPTAPTPESPGTIGKGRP